MFMNNYELTLGSDGFLPFEDNVYEAKKYGIKNIIQPGGSINDRNILRLSEKIGINMVFTGKRLFTH